MLRRAVSLCAEEIERSGEVWFYRPKQHKTGHLGKQRTIYIGKRCQAVLAPFLLRHSTGPLFRPSDAMVWHKQQRGPVPEEEKSPSRRKRDAERAKNPKRVHDDKYSVDSYRQAIQRACEQLEILAWVPNQLRHAAATNIRKEFGLEVAQAVLGHSSAKVTEIYAELDRELALKAVEKLG